MTRRVAEPSQERKARQGVWGVEDLRERPAPLVEAAGDACLYAESVWFGLQTLADDTPYDLIDLDGTGVDGEWSAGDSYVSDPDQIEIDMASGEITVLDPPGGGLQQQGGIWIAQLRVLYDDQFTGDMWTGINWSSWNTQMDVDLQHHKAQGANTHVFGETGFCTSMALVYNATPASNPSLKGLFWQVSGAGQDVFMVVFSLARMCRYPTPTGSFVSDL